jgi:hypothetical protein
MKYLVKIVCNLFLLSYEKLRGHSIEICKNRCYFPWVARKRRPRYNREGIYVMNQGRIYGKNKESKDKYTEAFVSGGF